MQHHTASQKFHCITFNQDARVTGESANLSCTLSIDGGARSALNDTTATEINSSGEYTFDLTQAETNGHALSFVPTCSTPGVQVLGTPANLIYTESGGSGTGLYALTVTVENGSGDKIQGARISIQGTTYAQVSDSDGTVVFNLDPGSYVLVTAPPTGYDTPANVPKTISADDTASIVLTATVASGSVGWLG